MAKKEKNKPQLDGALEGFNITINSFGEINTTMDIKRLNEFLDENVADKKLVDRDDHKNNKLKKNKPAAGDKSEEV
jgi:hypothetical protein